MSFRGQLFIFVSLFHCASALEMDLVSLNGIGSSGGNVACAEACRKIFTNGSPSKKDVWDLDRLEDSCQRGCRFYAIVELLNKSADDINTLKSCYDNCYDAYLGRYKENEACRTGCDHQQPFKMKKAREDLEATRSDGRENVFSVLYPIMQIHGLYKSMQKASWSFFTVPDKEGNSADLVIVQTKPLVHHRDQNFNHFLFSKEDGRHSGDFESLRHSQSKATSSFSVVDWLGYLPQSTGMPGTFVFILLLLPALALMWLCVSAAETAPDQHLKLGGKTGNLDYIHTLQPEKKGILAVYQAASVGARPLPGKMTVDKL